MYVIHQNVVDTKGSGRWDINTGRYIPVSGGSRSKLPIGDDPDIRRYYGFIGINESMTAEFSTLAVYFNRVGGGVYIPEGDAGKFIQLILDQSKKWIGGDQQQDGSIQS